MSDPDQLAAVATEWLDALNTGWASQDPTAISALVEPDGYWKDIVAFTWAYRTFSGTAEIERGLKLTLDDVRPRNARIAQDRTPPRLVKRSARKVIEAYFDFDTEAGRGTGFVRLPYDPDAPGAPKAWILLTTLQELANAPQAIGEHRPTGVEFSESFSGDNWLDQRTKRQAYTDRDPEVLIVGGGQSGLILAARLGLMGVDVLVVERNDRIGDNWRQRYHSLTLHNEVWANSMPYMPFPPNWPTFVPKDKLAGWLEAYAEFMELNVWTGTSFSSGDYDETTRTWTATLTRADGTERTIHCPHLVLATGGSSGVPNMPQLPGLADFRGEVLHSSAFGSGTSYTEKKAIVFGTGNSGHDVAQDLHANGAAEVTIIQRSPTCVVSLVPSGTMVYALYSEGPSNDDIDLITAAIPYPVLRDTYQWLTKRTCELDKDLLDKLHAVGFETDYEPDGTGFHMKYLRKGGGYYINVGCSDLIADGEIALRHARDIDRFEPEGLRFADGTTVEADLVVLATGYDNLQEGVRRLLGDEIADRVGPIWGFDDHGAMRNMWMRTAQPGFWVMGGSLIDARLHSTFLAVQIKAELDGLMPGQLPV
ncbi:NAD(P)/FAD-dependent oxidoreductase [Pseudonocardia sp. NPDC049154]|uniref:flavin-containing monooxygenase n=1 Tax=Pseudonocardia sp. NPDC049154 TaxID=3155501 RepID=UPI00340C8FA7